MRNAILSLAAIAAALVAGSQAFGAVNPRLVVVSNDATLTTSYSQGASDDAIARLNLLVPPEYLVQGGLPANLTVATVQATVSGSATTGTIVVGDATTPVTVNGVASTLGAQYAGCTGDSTTASVGYWLATIGSVQAPVYLQQVLPETQFAYSAFYAIKICFSSSPAVSSLNMTFNGLWSSPPGWDLWRAIVTPYSGTTVNTSSTVETQSVDRTPQELTLTAKAGGWVAGRVVQGGKGVGGQSVTLTMGGKVVKTVKTNGSGYYRAKLGAKGRVSASVTVPTRELGACEENENLASSCSGLTVGGFTAKAAPVTLKR